MADSTEPETTTPQTGDAQPNGAGGQPSVTDGAQVRRLAQQLTTFAREHGGSAGGQVAHLGRGTVRIALVGADGRWGNLVAGSRRDAERAAELAGITLHDTFDGELAAGVRTGPYEWTRMAGIQLGGGAPGRSG